MKSKDYRSNPLFLRNEFETEGKFQFPRIRKQDVDLFKIRLISATDAKYNDSEENRKKGLHFFVDDYKFLAAYNNPEKFLEKVSQYMFACTPDFSAYADMNYWRQIESVGHSRWCGAFWQSQGVKVIPTIGWSTKASYDFCFDAVEKGSTVAIGMIGCKHAKEEFLAGYSEMLRRIEPEAILCVGRPFEEMEGNIIAVDYPAFGKVGR